MNKISIIVAIYNVEDYLHKCIYSLINQNYKNLEIILIDDGSSDSSGQICEYFAEKDKRIQVIHQENKGIAAVRKIGINQASGEYMGFVDGDDWIYPDMYEILIDKIISTDSDIAVCDFVIGKGFKGCNEFDSENYAIESRVLSGDKKIYEVICNTNNSFCNKLFKKSILSKLNIPENKIYEDVYSMYLLYDNAERIVITNERKYYYTYRASSISNELYNIRQFNVIEAYIERLKYLYRNYCNNEDLIKYATKFLWLSFLSNISNVSHTKLSENDMKYILHITEELKKFDYKSCGLDVTTIKLLDSIVASPKAYFQLISLISKK